MFVLTTDTENKEVAWKGYCERLLLNVENAWDKQGLLYTDPTEGVAR